MYAVIKTGGKQYKVSKDDVISVEKLSDDAGKKIKLNEVLIISDKGKPIVGDPLIKGASVEAEIIDHSRAAKITVFKKKRRHNYRRKKGHKQDLTAVRIQSIDLKKVGTKTTKKETNVKAPEDKSIIKDEKKVDTKSKAAPKKAEKKTTTKKAAPKTAAKKATPKKVAKKE